LLIPVKRLLGKARPHMTLAVEWDVKPLQILSVCVSKINQNRLNQYWKFRLQSGMAECTLWSIVDELWWPCQYSLCKWQLSGYTYKKWAHIFKGEI